VLAVALRADGAFSPGAPVLPRPVECGVDDGTLNRFGGRDGGGQAAGPAPTTATSTFHDAAVVNPTG